ncbi:uncharacterized protein MONOS_7806 [Monocercomonoides exilis]|uniref:uncharacterized protein n=1 Tax=Monocercomonoides exilis TaxID=2049356 RepID=UPI0035599EA6|nr:hypothetical protein MONOS_7806 [Monocercomonoides exilis]|eukprot:MONOS_7806.1-p1 / transcript=MONOS_7806.1 / gene=MONOS_7806 / organism=Monocercomonoides_exilis_PA203 / gene_product=unspecified product / transcript_product=unspecified product / location=Mono_scaffold00277:12134-13929(-) / protein_length=414 / sequence_SO=supercontig / SO=protein_coding / is_pseudo=false
MDHTNEVQQDESEMKVDAVRTNHKGCNAYSLHASVAVQEQINFADRTINELKDLHKDVENAVEQIQISSMHQAKGHEEVLFRSFQEHLRSIQKDLEHRRQKQPDFDAGHWMEKKKETDKIIELIEDRLEKMNNTTSALNAELRIVSRQAKKEEEVSNELLLNLIRLRKENEELRKEIAEAKEVAYINTMEKRAASERDYSSLESPSFGREVNRRTFLSPAVPAFPSSAYESSPSSTSHQNQSVSTEMQTARLRQQAESIIKQINLEEKKIQTAERERERRRNREREYDGELFLEWKRCVKKIWKEKVSEEKKQMRGGEGGEEGRGEGEEGEGEGTRAGRESPAMKTFGTVPGSAEEMTEAQKERKASFRLKTGSDPPYFSWDFDGEDRKKILELFLSSRVVGTTLRRMKQPSF